MKYEQTNFSRFGLLLVLQGIFVIIYGVGNNLEWRSDWDITEVDTFLPPVREKSK